MIKLIIFLLNFAFFKVRLVIETSAIVLVQAGVQTNQLASTIYHRGNITDFLKTQKRHVLIFCVCHKKGILGKHPICENNTYIYNLENELLLVRLFFLQSVLSS